GVAGRGGGRWGRVSFGGARGGGAVVPAGFHAPVAVADQRPLHVGEDPAIEDVGRAPDHVSREGRGHGLGVLADAARVALVRGVGLVQLRLVILQQVLVRGRRL